MLGFSYPGLALLTGSLLLINQANAQTFDLLVSHSGTEFFDGWTFEKGYDNTSGCLDMLIWNHQSRAHVDLILVSLSQWRHGME